MVKIKKIVSAKIEKAFKDVGAVVEPLSEAEYKSLEKKIKLVKDPTMMNPFPAFNEVSDMIFVKIPESFPVQDRTMKDGTIRYSVPFILADDNWCNLLVDGEAEIVKLHPNHAGQNAVIVGKIVEKVSIQNPETVFRNVKGYRGMIILESEPEEVDSDEVDEDTEEEF